MKKELMRWAAGLLAGSALVAGGCGGPRGERETGERETGAFQTPTQERHQPPSADEARPLGPAYGHPSGQDQESRAATLSRDAPVGGGTAAPNTLMQTAPAGQGGGHDALGTSLADSYRTPPEGSATGGAGGAGQEAGGPSR